jgi:hypothetical protein
VRSRPGSSIQASIGRVSRRSEIFSTGDGLAAGGSINCLGGVGLATQCLEQPFVIGSFLGATETFGAGFLLLVFLLVLFTAAFLAASMTFIGVGLGAGAGWALAKRPPRSTWLRHLRGSAAQGTAEGERAPSGIVRRMRRFSLQAPQMPA